MAMPRAMGRSNHHLLSQPGRSEVHCNSGQREIQAGAAQSRSDSLLTLESTLWQADHVEGRESTRDIDLYSISSALIPKIAAEWMIDITLAVPSQTPVECVLR